MIRGPERYYKCPECGNLMKKGSLVSGNTIGGKRYSDGRVFAKGLRNYPRITKCKKCQHIFWLYHEIKSKNIPEIEEDKQQLKEWRDYKREKPFSEKDNNEPVYPENIDYINFLSIEDNQKALDLNLYNTQDEEKHLRTSIWRAFNSRVRDEKALINNESEKDLYFKNLDHLIDINLEEIEKLKKEKKEADIRAEKDREENKNQEVNDAINFGPNFDKEISNTILLVAELYRNKGDFRKSKDHLTEAKQYINKDEFRNEYFEHQISEMEKRIDEKEQLVYLISPLPKKPRGKDIHLGFIKLP